MAKCAREREGIDSRTITKDSLLFFHISGRQCTFSKLALTPFFSFKVIEICICSFIEHNRKYIANGSIPEWAVNELYESFCSGRKQTAAVFREASAHPFD